MNISDSCPMSQRRRAITDPLKWRCATGRPLPPASWKYDQFSARATIENEVRGDEQKAEEGDEHSRYLGITLVIPGSEVPAMFRREVLTGISKTHGMLA